MFNLHHKADLLEIERFTCALTEANAKLLAISRSMALIEFSPDGIVLDANDNFCKTMGYSVEELRGKHHRIFCEEAFYRSEAYSTLWRDLARGEPLSGTFLRLGKSGQEIWLEASYMPVLGPDRQVRSVIKVAADVSERIHIEHENQSLLNAIGRSMAVIEFTPEGKVISANDNFLKTMGYALNEIVGQHHSMFCHRGPKRSPRNTERSGPPSIVANTTPTASSEKTNTARRCSSRPPTTPCSMPRGACTRWSSSPAISPSR